MRVSVSQIFLQNRRETQGHLIFARQDVTRGIRLLQKSKLDNNAINMNVSNDAFQILHEFTIVNNISSGTKIILEG